VNPPSSAGADADAVAATLSSRITAVHIAWLEIVLDLLDRLENLGPDSRTEIIAELRADRPDEPGR
jgi:hypothetical protein